MYATKAEVDALYRRIQTLEKLIRRLQNNTAPTIPIYDSSNWPLDAVEGQVVIAQLPGTPFPTGTIDSGGATEGSGSDGGVTPPTPPPPTLTADFEF